MGASMNDFLTGFATGLRTAGRVLVLFPLLLLTLVIDPIAIALEASASVLNRITLHVDMMIDRVARFLSEDHYRG